MITSNAEILIMVNWSQFTGHSTATFHLITATASSYLLCAALNDDAENKMLMSLVSCIFIMLSSCMTSLASVNMMKEWILNQPAFCFLYDSLLSQVHYFLAHFPINPIIQSKQLFEMSWKWFHPMNNMHLCLIWWVELTSWWIFFLIKTS